MRYSASSWSIRALGAALVFTAAGSAFGATIVPGEYQLRNHPDGNAQPPQYGAKFTKLYDVAGDPNDIFTLDFNHPQSDMRLTYTGSTITISGQSWGGRDIGATYAVDQYLGLYTISFTYNVGVMLAGGDDDVIVNTATHTNLGSITTPLNDTIDLFDEHMGGYSFRLGDENNDLGHRGFAGVSGWGWMSYVRDNGVHIADTDWLFTVERMIPTPGSAALLVAGLGMVSRRRRQR